MDESVTSSESLLLRLHLLTKKLSAAFPAFSSKNYQLYFYGQLISNIGTWLHILGQGWLVLQVTHSAFWVGTVTALSSLPVLLFSLWAGVIVDRFTTRKLLIVTQISSMILAGIFGLLTITNLITLPEICLISFLLGTVDALDKPARQTFVVEMVGRKLLPSAIALNSSMFNVARIIGPGTAGILIGLVGIGGTFLINSVSYIAAIMALNAMDINATPPQSNMHPFKAIKAGVHYSVTHPLIRYLLFFIGTTSIFGWSYTTMLSVIVDHVYHKGATELGYLYVFIGIGAIMGAVIVSAFAKTISKFFLMCFGNFIAMVSIIGFSFINTMHTALPLLIFIGLGLIIQASLINTVIQEVVPNHLRGRVMGVYTTIFMGFLPIGSFQVGFLADHFGPQFAIRVGAALTLFAGFYMFAKRHTLEQTYQENLPH